MADPRSGRFRPCNRIALPLRTYRSLSSLYPFFGIGVLVLNVRIADNPGVSRTQRRLWGVIGTRSTSLASMIELMNLDKVFSRCDAINIPKHVLLLEVAYLCS